MSRARIVSGSLVAWVALIPARVALACPDCAPIRAARAQIADDPGFWSYVLLTALPFVIVAGVAAVVHRTGGPPGEIVRS